MGLECGRVARCVQVPFVLVLKDLLAGETEMMIGFVAGDGFSDQDFLQQGVRVAEGASTRLVWSLTMMEGDLNTTVGNSESQLVFPVGVENSENSRE